MDNTKKTTFWARVISFVSASAVLATTLDFFQSGFGENLATVVGVWAWFLVIVGLIATLLLGVAGIVLLVTIDEDLSKAEKEKLTEAANQLTETRPKIFWSLPLTLYWVVALAYVDWTGLLVTYFVTSILGYLVVYGLLGHLRTAVDKAIVAKESSIREY